MDIKLAVLIDGDNIPSAYVKEMMEEIAKYDNPPMAISPSHIFPNGKTCCWRTRLRLYSSMVIPQERTPPILQ
jgi:hypothetical protein